MDQILEQAVVSALYLEPLFNAAHIFVTVRDGVVTLTGDVDTHAQKLAAKYKAECVPGVKAVADELHVHAFAKWRGGADEIAASVLNALHWDLAVPRDRVSAKCEGGWVTLSGDVDRPYQKSSAEADVRRIRGVVGVTNEINVRSSVAACAADAKIDMTRRGDPILLADPMRAIVRDRKTTGGQHAPLG